MTTHGEPGSCILTEADILAGRDDDCTMHAHVPKPRTNGVNPWDEGEPCDSCGEPLEWDAGERMIYCPNDWMHL